ncbi:MAG: hypothetical protein ACOY4N_05900 [Pseudomonadota bacterium]|uniref:hypothetical protein n=1 Tax=Sphingobium TaxID=165695 RepID=UPI00111D01B3|nr:MULTISPECIES: hypothetical protein [Sphingobium]QWT14772.1 hypothetical protein GTV57_03100 [Sphingobium xenophagum]
MDKDKPFSPFARAAQPPRPVQRDQDNTQQRMPPPQNIRLPNPRLAPPGMSGIRVPQPMEMGREASPIRVPKPPREVGKASDVNREFKSIVTERPDKGISRSR